MENKTKEIEELKKEREDFIVEYYKLEKQINEYLYNIFSNLQNEHPFFIKFNIYDNFCRNGETNKNIKITYALKDVISSVKYDKDIMIFGHDFELKIQENNIYMSNGAMDCNKDSYLLLKEIIGIVAKKIRKNSFLSLLYKNPLVVEFFEVIDRLDKNATEQGDIVEIAMQKRKETLKKEFKNLLVVGAEIKDVSPKHNTEGYNGYRVSKITKKYVHFEKLLPSGYFSTFKFKISNTESIYLVEKLKNVDI